MRFSRELTLLSRAAGVFYVSLCTFLGLFTLALKAPERSCQLSYFFFGMNSCFIHAKTRVECISYKGQFVS